VHSRIEVDFEDNLKFLSSLPTSLENVCNICIRGSCCLSSNCHVCCSIQNEVRPMLPPCQHCARADGSPVCTGDRRDWRLVLLMVRSVISFQRTSKKCKYMHEVFERTLQRVGRQHVAIVQGDKKFTFGNKRTAVLPTVCTLPGLTSVLAAAPR